MSCHGSFPEERLSGYLDRALTQAEDQQVRLHLEDCDSCRRLYRELSQIRRAAASTSFATPGEEEWDELPKTALSRASRRLGGILLGLWAIGMLLFILWQVAHAPGPWTQKALIFGSLSGLGLLLLSALLDRRLALRSDRYTRVRR